MKKKKPVRKIKRQRTKRNQQCQDKYNDIESGVLDKLK